METRYGKLENGTVKYAGNVIRVDGAVVVRPRAAHLAAAGYLPVLDEKPVAPEGKYAHATGWLEQDGRIVRQYELRDIPPRPPRTFSKLKVVAALTKAGVWPQVKAWIEQAGLYDLYLAAQDFAEDNAYFTQGKAALQQALGWSDGQVEAVLAASLKEAER